MDVYDPDSITKKDMDDFADGLERYLHVFQEIMIIPDEIKKDVGDEMEESIKIVKQLIKKLRKGDRSVFKDADEWNNIC